MGQLVEHEVRKDATELHVLDSIEALGSLPKRDSDQAELDLAAYYVALSGVPASFLAVAVRQILQGVLGHAFFPSPPEFRIVCNRIWKAHSDEMKRKAHEEQAERQRLEDEVLRQRKATKSLDEKRRVLRLYAKFLEDGYNGDQADKPDAIRQRYDARKLAAVPDAPTGTKRLRPELQPYAHYLQEDHQP